jgi:hypothetical protein
VLDELRSERFMDDSPAQVYATLLDEGTYLASQSTMYRLLAANGEVRERRDQLRRPNYAKPELLATKPNELWSWDITKLFAPQKWAYYYLYVILDVFSRHVVGWMVAHRESAVLAEKLIGETLAKQGIARPVDSARRPRLLHEVEVGGVPTRRPGRDEIAFATARLQRQPVLGVALQDDEVPAGLFRPLRMHPGCPSVWAAVLRLVQRRAPALRAGVAHARIRPLRTCRRHSGAALCDPHRGLRSSP